MPNLRSHTHLQATQASTHAKARKRVCLPNRTNTVTLDRQATTEKEGRTHNIKPYLQKPRQAKDLKIKNSDKRLTK